MEKAYYGDGRPIAAPATAPGRSALALIRTSGGGAIELAARVFSGGEKLLRTPGGRVLHGWICQGDRRIDEVLCSVYRAPRSYTGEDGVDISCHGGQAVRRDVLSALLEAGFREALPGEFTFRAFINGKLGLTQSEAVMELVEARTGAARERAAARLEGSLEAEIRSLRDALVDILGEIELCLDYSELDGVYQTGPGLPPRTAGVLERLQRLAGAYAAERLYQEGALAVIAGRPNAGKSSLFNRLLREERAIVTDTPGATRDWLEAWLDICGIPFRLADTAGLRDSSEPLEKAGIDKSRSLLEAADLSLYLVDGTAGLQSEDEPYMQASGKRLLLWSKSDIAPPPPPGFLAVSARTGEGIDALLEAMASALDGGPPEEAPGSGRQKALIDGAAAALREALAEKSLDLAAPLVREAADRLGEITGEVSTAEILENIFSRFCVGK